MLGRAEMSTAITSLERPASFAHAAALTRYSTLSGSSATACSNPSGCLARAACPQMTERQHGGRLAREHPVIAADRAVELTASSALDQSFTRDSGFLGTVLAQRVPSQEPVERRALRKPRQRLAQEVRRLAALPFPVDRADPRYAVARLGMRFRAGDLDGAAPRPVGET